MLIEFKNFKIYKDSYGKPFKRDYTATVVFLTQILLTFGGRCNRFFIPLKWKPVSYWSILGKGMRLSRERPLVGRSVA